MSFQTSISPVIKSIGMTLGLSYPLKTILMSVPSLGAMAMMIPAGRMLDRTHPVRFAFPFFLVMICVSFASLFATGFWFMFVLRLLAGFAFAPLLIYGIQLISLKAEPSQKNRLSTIQTLGAPMAYLMTAVLSPLIARTLGFQFTYLIPLLFALAGLVLTARFWDIDIESRHGDSAEKGWISRESVILAACWGLFTLCTSVFLFLGANMAQDHGFSDIVAGLGNLSFAVPAMIVGFFIGNLLDRKVSRFALMTTAPVFLGIFVFITSLGQAWWITGVVFMGFFASLIPPVIFTTPPRIEKPGRIAQAIGFINMVGTFSMLVSSPIAGILKDVSGSWLASFGFAGLMGILITFVTFSIRRGLS